jgi:uncharacterized membrane protein
MKGRSRLPAASARPGGSRDDVLSDTRLVDQAGIVTNSRPVDDESATVLSPVGSIWERALPWVLALVFAAVYVTISVARFERLATRSFDLGIFEQAIRHYAHFQAPIVDLEGPGHNFLGDHWSPAIAVFAPFYRLFPGPVTLLVGQAVVIALGVVPIARAGMRHLGRWQGVAVALAFGMSYGVQSAVDFDFHEVCLAVPLLAFALEAFLAGRLTRVVAWAAPLVLVKEDLGLTVAALGLVLVLTGARRWGLGLAAFGLGSFVLTVTVLLPHFNAQTGDSRFSVLAAPSGKGDPLLNRLLSLPLEVATSVPGATTVLLMLAVTAFLATQSPLLVLVLPTLTWRFLSTNEYVWGQSFHYDLVLMPVLFAALVDGVVRNSRDSWRPLRLYAGVAPTLALVVAVFLCSRFAFKDLVDPVTYQLSPRAQSAEHVLAEIPDGSTVETDLGLIARLTNRAQVFFVGNAAPVVPQFVLIADTDQDPAMRDAVKYAQALHPGKRYALVYDHDRYTLVRRVD